MLLASTACGRLRFDVSGSDASGARADGVFDGVSDGMNDDGGQPAIDAAAVTVTFGEDPAAIVQGVTIDTYLSNDTGGSNLNYGVSTDLRMEGDKGERALITFDLSVIPSSATILSATLRLTVTQANPTEMVAIHPVLEAWVEGSADGTVGEASFVYRQPLVMWSTPGASVPNSAAPSFTAFTPSPLGAQVISLDAGVVQGWVGDPSTNHGLVLIASGIASSRIAAKESSPGSSRPMLTVTYVP